MAETEVGKGEKEGKVLCCQSCTQLSPAVFVSLSSVNSACTFQSELRTSISTNASDQPQTLITNPRRKLRRPLLKPSQAQCFQPLDSNDAAQLSSTVAKLADLYQQLLDELEPICVRECKPKQRTCQLDSVPAASSLMRRRGLAALSL